MDEAALAQRVEVGDGLAVRVKLALVSLLDGHALAAARLLLSIHVSIAAQWAGAGPEEGTADSESEVSVPATPPAVAAVPAGLSRRRHCPRHASHRHCYPSARRSSIIFKYVRKIAESDLKTTKNSSTPALAIPCRSVAVSDM